MLYLHQNYSFLKKLIGFKSSFIFRIQQQQLMENIKRFLKFHKLQNQIRQILDIPELSFIKDKYFRKVINSIQKIVQNQQRFLLQLLNDIIKQYFTKQTKIFRVLFIIHQILRQNTNPKITQVLIKSLFEISRLLKIIDQQQREGINQYLKNNFCLPYAAYLIKTFQKKMEQLQFQTQSSMRCKIIKNCKRQQNLLISIQIDFNILNTVSEILKFNPDINQMGRYYSQHQYIINFFLQMLKDLKIHYETIKNKFQAFIKRNQQRNSEQQREKIYLYLSQAERCVNKMNLFYYNKYLYYYINEMIQLHMNLQIPSQFYKQVNKTLRNQTINAYSGSYKTKKYNSQNLETKQSSRTKSIDQTTKIILSIQSMTETLQQLQNLKQR